MIRLNMSRFNQSWRYKFSVQIIYYIRKAFQDFLNQRKKNQFFSKYIYLIGSSNDDGDSDSSSGESQNVEGENFYPASPQYLGGTPDTIALVSRIFYQCTFPRRFPLHSHNENYESFL